MPKVHMIGNAHIDPVWLWRFQAGYAEIKATFAAALDRLDQYPDFIFTSACAAYYKWVEENAPDMFEKIKSRIHEGRWEIAGGMWIQPDVNVPSGESFARHFLYSQRYFSKKLGVLADCGYNVDSFGHNAMLPALLKNAGINNYVMMRPDKHENPDMPQYLFIWEGVDGSRVITNRIESGYGFGGENVKDRIDTSIEASEKSGFPVTCFYGVGNHGGGPTIQTIEAIHKYQNEYPEGADTFPLSSPSEYFKEVIASGVAENLPIWKGELQHHASGCYSAMSKVKAQNRKAENRLVGAELYATLARQILGVEYSRETVQSAWENVLFNQFHDIMGGCSIKEAYDDAMESYGESLSIAAKLQNSALQSMSWAVDTLAEAECVRSKENDFRLWEIDGLGTPVVVFNPHAWSVYTPVQVSREVSHVTDDAGTELIIQTVRASQTNGNDKWNTLFMSEVPAMGYRLFRIYIGDINPKSRKGTGIQKEITPLSIGEDNDCYYIENEFIKARFNKMSGYIDGLFDKKAGKETLSAPGGLPVVINVEHCDTWAHRVFTFDIEEGAFSDASFNILETGPIRVCLRVTTKYRASTLRQDYYLYAHKPDIEVRATLDFYEKNRMLKLSFPIAGDNPKAAFEIPNGYIERPVNGTEESGQRFADISANGHGLAILNDGKYSFSAKDNDFRMTVANSSIYADHYGQETRDEQCEHIDMGRQEFAYAIVAHEGTWQDAGIARKAVEFNLKPEHVIETYHAGPLPSSFEGISITGDEGKLIVSAYKRAEELPGYILRLYESTGGNISCKISLPPLNVSFSTKFAPLETKTFFIPDAHEGEISEVLTTEVGKHSS